MILEPSIKSARPCYYYIVSLLAVWAESEWIRRRPPGEKLKVAFELSESYVWDTTEVTKQTPHHEFLGSNFLSRDLKTIVVLIWSKL